MSRKMKQVTYLEPTGPGCLGIILRILAVLIVLGIVVAVVA